MNIQFAVNNILVYFFSYNNNNNNKIESLNYLKSFLIIKIIKIYKNYNVTIEWREHSTMLFRQIFVLNKRILKSN